MRKRRFRLRREVLDDIIPMYVHKGRTLKVVAGLAGIPYDTVWCWISGCDHKHRSQSLTTKDKAEAFAEAARVPVNDLFEELNF